MDPQVLSSLAKWPNVPAVYGWLALDRRGNWLLREGAAGSYGRIGNVAMRGCISRNYAADERGCWYFQNGPQRVYVKLAYTPFVVHFEGDTLVDHCGWPVDVLEKYVDEEGSMLVHGRRGAGLLDDRDLARCADGAERLPRLAKSEVEARFRFVADPAISLR